MVNDNVIPLRAACKDAVLELAYIEIARKLAKLERLEAAVLAFNSHVETRRSAGWLKVPHHPTEHGGVGLRQLLAIATDEEER